MRHASDHLIASGGVRLATRAWLPQGDAEAAVVLVHGYGEHIGRHERLATELARGSYAVHGFDLRGHGYSQGERANVTRFAVLIDDLAAFVGEVRDWHPDARLVLFGHSMGGVIALRAMEEWLVAPDLAVLSSPLLRDALRVPRVVRRVLMALSEPFPWLPTVSLDPTAISRDPIEVDAYRLDPAVYHGPTKARIGAEMVRQGALALALAGRVTMPVLLVQGTGDRIADPTAVGELDRALPDASLRLYDDGPHELFHDAYRERVTADVLAWLQARLSPDERPEAA